jgi:phosphoribosylglycinamide formyltransferase-1
MTPIRIGVLASGRGTNFEAIADACARGEISGEIALVLSDVSDAPVLEKAKKRGISAEFCAFSEREFAKKLEQAGVNLVALAGFMRILRGELLEKFGGRILNVHPSLLPAFRGLRAWEQALAAGARVTGVTVHFVDEKVDSGPIILQEAVPILPNDTPESLHARLQEVEHRLFPRAIQLFAEGRLKIRGRTVEILP